MPDDAREQGEYSAIQLSQLHPASMGRSYGSSDLATRFGLLESVLLDKAFSGSESMRRETPLKIMLMPTRVPITQTELTGQERHIMIARMRVTTPSTRASRLRDGGGAGSTG